jgi:DEAD/DEAH box helicase domain-containing protein
VHLVSLSIPIRYHTHPKYLPFPSKHISIRGAKEETYVIVDITKTGNAAGSGKILEEVELSRALFEIYEGAVVRHFFAAHSTPT